MDTPNGSGTTKAAPRAEQTTLADGQIYFVSTEQSNDAELARSYSGTITTGSSRDLGNVDTSTIIPTSDSATEVYSSLTDSPTSVLTIKPSPGHKPSPLTLLSVGVGVSGLHE